MFTRNRYDVQDYNRDLYQTIRPGHFRTNLPSNDCEGCLNPNPAHNASFGSSIYANNLMDVDSELMGLNVKNTKCRENKFNPEKDDNISLGLTILRAIKLLSEKNLKNLNI